MDLMKNKIRLAGVLLWSCMLAGIFSIAPSIDVAAYLTEAAANSSQVIYAAVFQFIMSLAYVGVAILLYPIIKTLGSSLSIGFLSFRIIAGSLSIIGTAILLSILILSQEFLQNPSQNHAALEALGNVLKASRDYVNHVFMVLVLCAGNLMFYILLVKTKLIPQWLSVWGIVGAFLSAIASILVLFQALDIITTEYLALNAPTAIHELILGGWLIVRGFKTAGSTKNE